ncbi:MAG: hypothetical protein ABIF06_02115 [bacterium]
MKKIIFALIVLIALGFLLTSTKNWTTNEKTGTEIEVVNPEQVDKDKLSISLPSITAPNLNFALPFIGNPLAEKAWNIFQGYLRGAHEHDLPGIRVLSHQISDTCNDPAQEETCYYLMDSVYTLGSSFEKNVFTHIWSDEKQIILATDYKQVDDEQAEVRGLTRAMLYFTLDKNGNPKVLSFNNISGVFLRKTELDDEVINTRLQEMVADTDEDGLSDEAELCLSTNFSSRECVKSDPEIRDTNGDGWWDGIEIFFYPQN